MKRNDEQNNAPANTDATTNAALAQADPAETQKLAEETGAEASVVEGAVATIAEAGATPPKKGRFDFNPSKVASTRRGAKVRSNIFYEVIGVPGENVKMQPQKALCLQLVNANTSDDNPRISEPELKSILEAAKADGTLDTKQEAWRIFAYYKGELVEEGYLAEHNVAPTKKAS